MYYFLNLVEFWNSGTVVPPPATVPENTCWPEKIRMGGAVTEEKEEGHSRSFHVSLTNDFFGKAPFFILHP
jgi:hypothetical protein